MVYDWLLHNDYDNVKVRNQVINFSKSYKYIII